jgi:hypothetical protein
VTTDDTPKQGIPWRLDAVQSTSLPAFLRRGLVPDRPVEQACELCDTTAQLATILVIDGPDGLPVPFLVCDRCRRPLDELHALLESAAVGS